MTIRGIALSALVTIVVAGCSTGPTAATNPTTCAEWRLMSETAQTELATAIVDANDLLEAVRAGQHEGPAVPRAALIQDVVGSIMKNCEVSRQPDQLVLDVALQLYGAGRASDGYFGASGAPTPQLQCSPPSHRAPCPVARAGGRKFPAKSSPGAP